MLLGFFCLLLLVSSCGNLPRDDSPAWSDSNRYSLEIENNCNLTKHSLGIAGCAFIGPIPASAKLTVLPLWHSRLEFLSTYCSSFSESSYNNSPVSLPINSIYTNSVGNPCSFQVNRFILGVDKKRLDKPIIGRFYIKIIPDSRYHALLKMEINKTPFMGVAWYQRPYKQDLPTLKVTPKGQKGAFIMKCGKEYIYNFDYTSSPFTVNIPAGRDCDFEISVINLENQYLEFATFIYMEQAYTEDLHKPKVRETKHYRHFEFVDDLNNKRKPAVIGVQVNDKICDKTHKCKDHINKDKYIVKGLTSSSRFFYGVYDSKTKSWVKE